MTLTGYVPICLAAAVLGSGAVAQAQDGICGNEIGDICCDLNVQRCIDGLECFDSFCGLPSPLDKLPIITLDLRITGCSDSDAVLPVRSFTVRSHPSLNPAAKSDVIVYLPTPVLTNGVTTIGLRIPGASTVADIKGLDWFLTSADCISRLELIVNDQVVGDFTTGITAPARDPSEVASQLGLLAEGLEVGDPFAPYSTISIPHTVMVQSQLAQDRDRVCAIPRVLSGEALLRQIAGPLGQAVLQYNQSSHGGAWFERSDFIDVHKVDDTTVEVLARIHATEGMVTFKFNLSIRCAPTQPTAENPNPTGSAISFDMSPIEVVNIDASDIFVGLADLVGLAKSIAEDSINGQLGSIRASLQEVSKGLPICPEFKFDGEPGVHAPNLSIGLPPLELFGVPDDLCR